MVVYSKNNKLYGTLGNIPRDIDRELSYQDSNGNIIILNNDDYYYDDTKGGIIRKSDGKTVNVLIDGFQIIPRKDNFPTVPEFKKYSAYLYEITISDLDYAFADYYFKQGGYGLSNKGNCTSAWKAGYLYRNFDWYYNEDVAFVTHVTELESQDFVHGKRFASVGVADSIPDLDRPFIESKQYSNGYKLIPFRVVDGVNSNGVGVSINVVPKQHGENPKTIPNIEEKHSIQASALVRFILDNFESATEAIEYIQDYVSIFPNKSLAQTNYEIHYIIGDTSKVYIAEIIDNKIVAKDITEEPTVKPIIANFHIFKDNTGTLIDLDENGHVYTPITAAEGKLPSMQGITSHGAGLERYNIIVDNYDSLNNFRDLVLYNKAYLSETNPQWYSEFTGNYTYNNSEFELTVDNTPEEFESTVMPIVRDLYKTRSRETELTWHTTHNSAYDLSNQQLTIIDSSESGIQYNFNLK